MTDTDTHTHAHPPSHPGLTPGVIAEAARVIEFYIIDEVMGRSSRRTSKSTSGAPPSSSSSAHARRSVDLKPTGGRKASANQTSSNRAPIVASRASLTLPINKVGFWYQDLGHQWSFTRHR